MKRVTRTYRIAASRPARAVTLVGMLALLFLFEGSALAQWPSSNGPDTYWTGGFVGIGTSTPLRQFHVGSGIAAITSNEPSRSYFISGQRGLVVGSAANLGEGVAIWHEGSGNDYIGSLFDGVSNALYIVNRASSSSNNVITATFKNGSLGLGTTNPGARLEVVGNIRISGNASIDTATGSLLIRPGGGTVDIGSSSTGTSYNLHVAGSVVADGNIAAKYQDLAEWVQTSRPIPVGSVVVVDSGLTNHVLPAMRAYDTAVAGVISSTPGIILGEGGEGKVKVATTGRVKVRVDAGNTPIRPGDLLVSSEKSGMAMRSEPVDVSGVKMHRPGTLIGKALEPLEEGEGEILVLLSLQ